MMSRYKRAAVDLHNSPILMVRPPPHTIFTFTGILRCAPYNLPTILRSRQHRTSDRMHCQQVHSMAMCTFLLLPVGS